MVDLTIAGDRLVLDVRGADKLWALKSSLEIPLAHVVGIRADPAIAQGWWHGLRMPGTSIPALDAAAAPHSGSSGHKWLSDSLGREWEPTGEASPRAGL